MSKSCVFAKTEIFSALGILDREYKKVYKKSTVRNIRLMKAYSKMAIVASGGWVEDGIKNLSEISISKLSEPRTQKKLVDIIDKIHGFSYSSHFSRGVINTFGAHGFEFIEAEVGDADIARLSSTLGKLKAWRDTAAHSYVTTIPCDPSTVISEMKTIFPILKKVEASARLYRKNHF